MSDREDEVFVRNFSLVLAGLVIIGLGAYVLAKIVNNDFQNTQEQGTTLSSRLQPVGTLNTGPEILNLKTNNQSSGADQDNASADVSLPKVTVGKCEVIISATDMMQYDATELKIDPSCSDLKLTLKHTGKLPANIMGHNVVFVADSNFNTLVSTIDMANGAENGYLPKSELILGQTAIIGGGESSSLILDLSRFEKGGSYTFFCSFPGHYSMMKGTLTI